MNYIFIDDAHRTAGFQQVLSPTFYHAGTPISTSLAQTGQH